MSDFMKVFNAVADIFAMPDTWQHATRRYLVGVMLIAVAISMDHWLGTCAPAFVVGYAIGGLTMYGNIKRAEKPDGR